MPGIDTTARTATYRDPPWIIEARWFDDPATHPKSQFVVQLTITKHDETWQKVTVVPPFGKSEAQALIGVLQSAVAALRDLEER